MTKFPNAMPSPALSLEMLRCLLRTQPLVVLSLTRPAFLSPVTRNVEMLAVEIDRLVVLTNERIAQVA